MRGFKSALRVNLTEPQKKELEQLARASLTPNALAQRARMVLLRAEELPIAHIAERLGTRRWLVGEWIKRYQREGLKGNAPKITRG